MASSRRANNSEHQPHACLNDIQQAMLISQRNSASKWLPSHSIAEHCHLSTAVYAFKTVVVSWSSNKIVRPLLQAIKKQLAECNRDKELFESHVLSYMGLFSVSGLGKSTILDCLLRLWADVQYLPQATALAPDKVRCSWSRSMASEQHMQLHNSSLYLLPAGYDCICTASCTSCMLVS